MNKTSLTYSTYIVCYWPCVQSRHFLEILVLKCPGSVLGIATIKNEIPVNFEDHNLDLELYKITIWNLNTALFFLFHYNVF